MAADKRSARDNAGSSGKTGSSSINAATLGARGTLNGVSGYSFTLTVIHNTPDQFQIVFSGNGLDLYNSGRNAISKGSIQIHS
jgi:hypothetical protein